MHVVATVGSCMKTEKMFFFLQCLRRQTRGRHRMHRTGDPRTSRKVTCRMSKRKATTTRSRWTRATRRSRRGSWTRRTTGGKRRTSWTPTRSRVGRRRRARCSPGARCSSWSPPSTSSATWAARSARAWPRPCTWRRRRWRSGSRTGGISGRGSWPRSWRRPTWAMRRRKGLCGFLYCTTSTGPRTRPGAPLQTHRATSRCWLFPTTCTIPTRCHCWGLFNTDCVHSAVNMFLNESELQWKKTKNILYIL